jgi:hypothetical protein
MARQCDITQLTGSPAISGCFRRFYQVETIDWCGSEVSVRVAQVRLRCMR